MWKPALAVIVNVWSVPFATDTAPLGEMLLARFSLDEDGRLADGSRVLIRYRAVGA